MRITRTVCTGTITLTDPKFIEKIIAFPEHGMGYSLVDVTLKNGVTIEQVVVANGDFVCFHDDMRKFIESEIASVKVSLV